KIKSEFSEALLQYSYYLQVTAKVVIDCHLQLEDTGSAERIRNSLEQKVEMDFGKIVITKDVFDPGPLHVYRIYLVKDFIPRTILEQISTHPEEVSCLFQCILLTRDLSRLVIQFGNEFDFLLNSYEISRLIEI